MGAAPSFKMSKMLATRTKAVAIGTTTSARLKGLSAELVIPSLRGSKSPTASLQ
jgi:hypothetical protein